MKVIVITAVLFLLIVSSAFAGMQPDPNAGDSKLGTAGKLRYASDSDPLNQMNLGYAFPSAGCGTGGARTVGGGFRMQGPKPGKRRVAETEPTDYFADSDDFPDDGWNVAGFGNASGELTAFSICSTGGHPEYRTQSVPADSSSVRTESVRCGRGLHVVSGGAIIASSSSYLNSSQPYDGGDKDKAPDDGWSARVFDTIGGTGGFEVYAICERGGSISYETKTQKLKKHHASSQRLSCSHREHATGGGIKVFGHGADAHLEGAYPYDSGDKGKTPDDGFKLQAFNDEGATKKIRSTVICVR